MKFNSAIAALIIAGTTALPTPPSVGNAVSPASLPASGAKPGAAGPTAELPATGTKSRPVDAAARTRVERPSGKRFQRMRVSDIDSASADQLMASASSTGKGSTRPPTDRTHVKTLPDSASAPTIPRPRKSSFGAADGSNSAASSAAEKRDSEETEDASDLELDKDWSARNAKDKRDAEADPRGVAGGHAAAATGGAGGGGGTSGDPEGTGEKGGAAALVASGDAPKYDGGFSGWWKSFTHNLNPKNWF